MLRFNQLEKKILNVWNSRCTTNHMPYCYRCIVFFMGYDFIAQYFCNNPYTEISHLKVKSKISPQTRILIQIDQKIRNSFEVVWKIEDLQTESVAVEINMIY